jgi:hypothetical protein
MKSLPSIVAVLGLGLPELVVIATILAILAAGAVAIVWIVIAVVRRGSSNPPHVPSQAQKKCPDCAEFVRTEARVCKYCGYRFDAEPPKA